MFHRRSICIKLCMFISTSPWSTKFSTAVHPQPAYAQPTYQINKFKNKDKTVLQYFTKLTSHVLFSYGLSYSEFDWRPPDKLGILSSPCVHPCVYTENPGLGTSSRRSCTDAHPWGEQCSLQQCPASPQHPPPTDTLQIKKRSKSIVAIFLYSNPCFATMWRFMWSMRLRRTWQIGQRVFPLCTLLCL